MDTPCIDVCVVDPLTGYCIGCGRSRAEIASWPDLPGEELSAIRDALPSRLRAMTSRSVRGGRVSRRNARRDGNEDQP